MGNKRVVWFSIVDAPKVVSPTAKSPDCVDVCWKGNMRYSPRLSVLSKPFGN